MPQYDAKYIEWIMQISQDVVSLNAPVNSQEGGEPENELGDFIEDPDPTPFEQVVIADRHDTIIKYIDRFLTPRENAVIRMRFGLDDGVSMTLEEVGSKFDLTRERIRQIEATALRKLRMQFKKHKITRENI